jgi:hypothetical protein
MATRKLEKVEELVAEEFKTTITPSGVGDAPKAAPVSAPASLAAPASAPAALLAEHKPDPVTLEVWLLTSGMKPDQMAGFRRWAKSCKLGPRVALDWERAHREFLARPV